jgi:hypothetical protein
VWTIDGADIHLRPSVDLGEIAPLVDELQAPVEGNQVKGAIAKRDAMLATVRTFVDPDDHAKFDKVSPDLDMQILVEMVQEVIGEYAGTTNPTKRSPSSDGSSTDGKTSTDGAVPEESTLPV